MVVPFAGAIFVGAFLLFQVQPLIGRYIIPWFGGTPEVWTVCMLFFQALLLGGYAYAHLSVSRLRPRLQSAVHLALLVAAVVLLPIIPSQVQKPDPSGNPTLQILLLLLVCVGGPYFVLSATGPLLQGWFVRTTQGRSPYPLYALSNAGSLLGLLTYPFLIEPYLTRRSQGTIWSGGLILFAVLCGLCALRVWRIRAPEVLKTEGAPSDRAKPQAPPIARRALWFALTAAASIELLAVTNKISQDIAAVPLLWIVPLGLYLLSFIICFHHQRWYLRAVFVPLFVASLIALGFAKGYAEDLSGAQQIWIHCAAFFACCMVCHGELFRSRPHPKHLTGYYLTIAAGAATGGFFVAVIAPLIFNAYLELYLALLLVCLVLVLNEKAPAFHRGGRRWIYTGLILVVGCAGIFAQGRSGDEDETRILALRNFFGVLTLWENDRADPNMHRYVLQHGTTFHGLQFVDPHRRLLPTAYYGPQSGVGLAVWRLRPQRPTRVGVVGLGVGTLAAYGKDGDVMIFYEINPEVTRLAWERFTYLSSTRAEVGVIEGDGRLSLERQDTQGFDLLVLDAFTSDAVPLHLLTVEAFETYLRHLRPEGVIAVHVSTVHLELQGVVWRLAEHFNLERAWIEGDEDESMGVFASDWILLTRDRELLSRPLVRRAATPPKASWNRVDLWTDDRVNLLQILR